MTYKIKDLFIRIFFTFMFGLGAFTFTIMGVYILPLLQQHMIDLGRPAVDLMAFLFSGGIAGGSIFILYITLEFIWKDFVKLQKREEK